MRRRGEDHRCATAGAVRRTALATGDLDCRRPRRDHPQQIGALAAGRPHPTRSPGRDDGTDPEQPVPVCWRRSVCFPAPGDADRAPDLGVVLCCVGGEYQAIQNFVYLWCEEDPVHGTALEDLRGFPDAVRRRCGYQLDRVQQGVEPTDWKPMVGVGSGVREIRVRDGSGAFRVIYVAKFADRVVVLHCFQKKSQKTSAADVATAKKRYQQVIADDGKGEQ
ncbi:MULTISPECIES: type II toxin-antitoxin system RelE/ParE family toxin [Rhodococcus]|uniref:type II toxin-antitoxin system RelE/ParE family toxin n=1 Tax=Rhodococcus TaxID=1827 RepID=UPI002E2B8B8E|nr:type II toxin-antitoxin system RelE/ParE family toxin [Rhodococcus sp. T7]